MRNTEVSRVLTALTEEERAMAESDDHGLCAILLSMSQEVDGRATEREYETDQDPVAAQINAGVNVMYMTANLLKALLEGGNTEPWLDNLGNAYIELMEAA